MREDALEERIEVARESRVVEERRFESRALDAQTRLAQSVRVARERERRGECGVMVLERPIAAPCRGHDASRDARGEAVSAERDQGDAGPQRVARGRVRAVGKRVE